LNTILVAPSILSADFATLASEVASVDRAGADWIHCDVMDGHFVPNLTFGPMVMKSVRAASKKPFDVHLMVSSPLRWAPRFAEAGADLISFHIECGEAPGDVIALIRSLGKKAGLALKPGTPAAEAKPFLKDLDFVLVMSVEPGFGGQSFMPDQAKKAGEFRRLRQDLGLDYLIEMDGGIDERTAPQAVAAGVEVLVAGTAVFSRPSRADAIAVLKGTARV
jgi:ribulose-phosphate 3-epimerase